MLEASSVECVRLCGGSVGQGQQASMWQEVAIHDVFSDCGSDACAPIVCRGDHHDHQHQTVEGSSGRS